MTEFVLVGGGAWARETFEWFAGYFASGEHKVVGYLEDGDSAKAGAKLRLPHLGPVAPDVIGPNVRLIMAVATPGVKIALADRFPDKTQFATLVHPTALVSASARLGCGVVLSPFSLVSADVEIGDFVTVNVHSSIGHDAIVESGVTLSSYVDLTGGVTVGSQSFWGSGARALPGVKIGPRTVIGAGAVVVRDVPEGATIYAMPGRRLQMDHPDQAPPKTD